MSTADAIAAFNARVAAATPTAVNRTLEPKTRVFGIVGLSCSIRPTFHSWTGRRLFAEAHSPVGLRWQAILLCPGSPLGGDGCRCGGRGQLVARLAGAHQFAYRSLDQSEDPPGKGGQSDE